MYETCRIARVLVAGGYALLMAVVAAAVEPPSREPAAHARGPDDATTVALKVRTASDPAPLAQVQWIAPPLKSDGSGPLPLLRKEFTADAKPTRATLRIVGLGDYDPRVNGTRLADTGINQPWSQ